MSKIGNNVDVIGNLETRDITVMEWNKLLTRHRLGKDYPDNPVGVKIAKILLAKV